MSKQQTQSEKSGSHVLVQSYMRHYLDGLRASDMAENDSRRARFYNLVQALKLTSGIEGATIEAGCFRGLSSFLLCRYLREEDSTFKGSGHFIVDSFEGLSEPIPHDGARSHLRWQEKAFSRTSVEHVRNTLSEFPEVIINKGWIPEVLDELPNQHYRFVHIDVDIYEPTQNCLEYFWPRLTPGGAIVIDDYGPWPENKWPGCLIAVNEFAKKHGIPFASLNTGNALFIRRC